MIQFQQAALRRGTKSLLNPTQLTIHPGFRLGITGANGVGKSSLFAVIRGELGLDAGRLDIPSDWVVAHVAQETPAVSDSALSYVLQGDAEWFAIRTQMREAEAAGAGDRLASLHDALERIDGYSAESRAAKLLFGLGFSHAMQNRAVAEFSGGWRMRLNLAQALMCRSQLLLLDEPTNHLDIEAVYWLEDWLRAYPGTLLVISHDRDFLDRVVTHIAHIEQQTLKLYVGNYSNFELARAEHLAHQRAAHQKQMRQVAHIQSFVTRFKAKATKAKQAQSRLKAIERMQQIAPAHVDSPFAFAFFPPKQLSAPLMHLEDASIGYETSTILNGVNFELLPGDRIGLLGPNGAGKSTLIKVLAGEIAVQSGRRKCSKALEIGYFAQHQLEQLQPDWSPLSHLQQLAPDASEQELRNFLGGFGFQGDEALQAVAPFSGGEKARLVLAMIVFQRPAILLLDEPTNHLDLEMRHALTLALQEFEGAMVVVSHDRHLLQSVADRLWLVQAGRVTAFDGDLEDYRRLRMAEQRSQDVTTAQPAKKRVDRQLAAQRRQSLQPLKQAVQRIEAELASCTEALNRVTDALNDTTLYTSGQAERLKALMLAQRAHQDTMLEIESRWLEASEALERAQQEDSDATHSI